MNWQNIPNRTEEFKRIRKAVIAPPSFKFVKTDYKQLQLVILAQASQDPFMIKIFNTPGADLHLEAAKLVAPKFGVADPLSVRNFSKNNLSFGRVFGIHPPKLVEQATKAGYKITFQQAQELLHALDAQSPRVEEYRREVHAYILEHQESRSLFGRRRIFIGLHMFDKAEREKALREGFNHVIQSTEADVYKHALVALSKLLSPSIRITNLVHDEVDMLIAESVLPGAIQAIRHTMEHLKAVEHWDVPLKVEISVGPNWAETEEVRG